MSRLASFVADARRRVGQGAYALDGPRLRPNGSLAAALRAHATPVIAELKPRSPSEGRLLQGPPEAMLAAFRDGGAAALSVLTDADHFDGAPALLRAAHATGLPTLMKDFVVDPAQLDAAAHHGASAVLLIERCFRRAEERERLVAAAHARGLEVLLEVHDTGDWSRAAASAADLVGVNARDLDTLEVDAAKALRLVSEIARAGVRGGPRRDAPPRPCVALSGVDGRAAYRAARAAGATAALVGTHLLRSPDPALALRALQRPLAKACGLRTPADVDAAAAAGADLVGLVVGSPGSPRELAPLAAQRLAQRAQERGLRTVLVTRGTDATLVLEWARLVRPSFVQLHGLVPSADLRHRLAAIPARVLAAVAPGAPVPPDCDGVLLDATAEGGAGRTHAWAAAPTRPALSLVAGGLDAGNVAAALAATGAWGADASSGLESAPGVKDPARIRAFVQAVHAA